MGIARWERIRRGSRGSYRKRGVRGGGWLFGDLTAEARVVWKGGLMELLSSGVKWSGFFGFFFPKMYQAIAVKTWFFEAFLAG